MEIIDPPQIPRDRILWILSYLGRKMERSRLRASIGMRNALLNHTLDELAKVGRIIRTIVKHGELISLKDCFL